MISLKTLYSDGVFSLLLPLLVSYVARYISFSLMKNQLKILSPKI